MILVEVHFGPLGRGRRSQAQMRAFFQHFQISRICHLPYKEANTIGCGGMCQEYAFLKLHPDF